MHPRNNAPSLEKQTGSLVPLPPLVARTKLPQQEVSLTVLHFLFFYPSRLSTSMTHPSPLALCALSLYCLHPVRRISSVAALNSRVWVGPHSAQVASVLLSANRGMPDRWMFVYRLNYTEITRRLGTGVRTSRNTRSFQSVLVKNNFL